MKRKGVFVPLEIWHLSELNPNERVLLAEVASFDDNGKPCFAGNDYFADLLNVAQSTARDYIYHLIELGYVQREGSRYERRLSQTTKTKSLIHENEVVNPRKRSRRFQHILSHILSHLLSHLLKAHTLRLCCLLKVMNFERHGMNGKSTNELTTDSNTKPPKANSGH